MESTRVRRLWLSVLGLVLSVVLIAPVPSLAAQDDEPPGPASAPDRAPSYQSGAPAGALLLQGDPPTIGGVIVEDPLNLPGVIGESVTCPTGHNIGEFVGEGFIVKVRGRCRDQSALAAMSVPIPNLDVPDGEIRLEAKIVSGHDRAEPFISVRRSVDPQLSYEINLMPAAGHVMFGKSVAGATKLASFATRNDLGSRISRDDWNEVAVRLDGTNIWVLLNGEPILSAADAALDRGGVSFGLGRRGDPNDGAESAVVFRNLRISRLAADQ